MLGLLLACTQQVTAPSDAPTPGDTAPGDTALGQDSGDTQDAAPLSDALCINELMADNEAALIDAEGNTPDWIELHNPTAEAVSLAGWRITDDTDEPNKHRLSEDLLIAPGAFLLLYADDAPDAGAAHLGFALSAAGGSVALFAPDNSGQVLSYGSITEDFSVARYDDCCTGSDCLVFDYRGTPGAANNPPEPVTEDVFPLGSDWRYLDTDVALEPDWTRIDFDDSSWPTGAGPLGFGDTHQVTLVESGPDGARIPTFYFRKAFILPEDALALSLDLMRDDGALVWLNGEEVLRSNLPEGSVGHETLASVAVGAPDEDTTVRYSIETGLVVGPNVLAVEVHQATATSSDLTFDLGVSVERLKTR